MVEAAAAARILQELGDAGLSFGERREARGRFMSGERGV